MVRGRAEDAARAATFDVVTSRAVAPLERLLGWSMPLVAPTGALVAMKGASAREEIEAAATGAAPRCGVRRPEVLELGVELLASPPTTVVRRWPGPTRRG